MNLRSVLQDPVAWKDPEIFNPDRHLNEDGKFIKNEALTPFGLGKLENPLYRILFDFLSFNFAYISNLNIYDASR